MLEARILPKGVSLEDACFGHLENRDRPQIIETNMPWWLALAIALPLAGSTVAAIIQYRRYKEKKVKESNQRRAAH